MLEVERDSMIGQACVEIDIQAREITELQEDYTRVKGKLEDMKKENELLRQHLQVCNKLNTILMTEEKKDNSEQQDSADAKNDERLERIQIFLRLIENSDKVYIHVCLFL